MVARCGLIMSQGEIYERAPMLTNLFAASRRLQFLYGNRSASLLHYWRITGELPIYLRPSPQ